MTIKKMLTIWLPISLSLIYIIFIALLSFDVFRLNVPVAQKIGGFIIENVPTIILLIALFLAREKPRNGGMMFIAISLIFTIFFKTYERWDAFVLISVPLILIGGLFLLSGKEKSISSI